MNTEIRVFGNSDDKAKVPELSKVQKASWDDFLQKDLIPGDRKLIGLRRKVQTTSKQNADIIIKRLIQMHDDGNR